VTSIEYGGRFRVAGGLRAQRRSGGAEVEAPQQASRVIPSGSADAADERRGFLEEAMELFPEQTGH